MPEIVVRDAPATAIKHLEAEGLHPTLARIYAGRGVTSARDLSTEFSGLASPESMLNLSRMAEILADAMASNKRLLIVADYDADGATACAVGILALRSFGAQVDYLVPNRFQYGYGLSPEIARLAHEQFRPDILITVDNGISSLEGVEECNRLGMNVLITDHHLPGPRLPEAACIVNPNQTGCTFPSKNLAGVGVMFYLMVALRAELRARHAGTPTNHGARPPGPDTAAAFVAPAATPNGNEPNLAALLPLVALGTVADVVALDHNNRLLIHQGLRRIRAERIPPGISALFQVAGRDPRRATTRDLGFAIAPRLNAAGRLSDMAMGIECLVSQELSRGVQIAQELNRLNQERREIELDMQGEALAELEATEFGDSCTLSLFNPAWHQGVIGILAGRIKDRFHRPTIMFGRSETGELRGSGRSISGLHLRDALERVSVQHPGLIIRFGGHAAAAGLTINEHNLDPFRKAFEEAARNMLAPADLKRVIVTDGELAIEEHRLDLVEQMDQGVWGQGFPRPLFHGTFEVVSQRIVGRRHLKLKLARSGQLLDAIVFGNSEAMPPRIRAVYRLDANDFQGQRNLQLIVEHWQHI